MFLPFFFFLEHRFAKSLEGKKNSNRESPFIIKNHLLRQLLVYFLILQICKHCPKMPGVPQWRRHIVLTSTELKFWKLGQSDSWKVFLKDNFDGEGNGNPLQYSCLEKSMDRGVWQLKSMGLHDWACMHEGGGKWVGSNKVVELKKKKKKR